jgi:hypothetical protein
MHAMDLVGINGITRVLLAYTCQQGVYPRGQVLPLRLPLSLCHTESSRRYRNITPDTCLLFPKISQYELLFGLSHRNYLMMSSDTMRGLFLYT